MELQLDKIIDALDDAQSGMGTSREHLNAAIRVLEVLKSLQGNIVGISDEDFEVMITKAIAGQ